MKKLTGPCTLRSPRSYDDPQQDDCNTKDGAQYAEEERRQLLAYQDGRASIYAQRKGEAPPAHVERDALLTSCLEKRGKSESQPE